MRHPNPPASLIIIPVLQMKKLRHSELKVIQLVSYRARIQTQAA